MAQRRFHYEQAFEHYLRANRLPYIAVDEAKKSLITPGKNRTDGTLKSFDFVVYGLKHNQLVDVKGRKIRAIRPPSTPNGSGATAPLKPGRLESWVTQDDVDSLAEWQRLFGPGFRAYFIFLYWCESQPPDALFQEIFEFNQRWYALRAVALDKYVKHMRVRSSSWKTLSIPTSTFAEISVSVKSLHQSNTPHESSSSP